MLKVLTTSIAVASTALDPIQTDESISTHSGIEASKRRLSNNDVLSTNNPSPTSQYDGSNINDSIYSLTPSSSSHSNANTIYGINTNNNMNVNMNTNTMNYNNINNMHPAYPNENSTKSLNPQQSNTENSDGLSSSFVELNGGKEKAGDDDVVKSMLGSNANHDTRFMHQKCKISLKGNHGKYLSAEGAKSGYNMVCDRSHRGGWEEFISIPLGNNTIALQSCHGKYLSAFNDSLTTNSKLIYFLFSIVVYLRGIDPIK